MDRPNLTSVQEGDRIDLIATRILGDPGRFAEIIDANPTLDPLDLTPSDILEVDNG